MPRARQTKTRRRSLALLSCGASNKINLRRHRRSLALEKEMLGAGRLLTRRRRSLFHKACGLSGKSLRGRRPFWLFCSWETGENGRFPGERWQ